MVPEPGAAGTGARPGQDEVRHQAAAMVTAAARARVLFSWVAGDEVYGRSGRLRQACEKAGKGYVLAVPVNFAVRLPSGRTVAVSSVAAMVSAAAWETRSCGPGCKGRRDYRWAWAATASPRHWLLVRRSLADPPDLAFYYCHVPQGPASPRPGATPASCPPPPPTGRPPTPAW